jgi:L-threonylcarbamoyladenylate synthase
MTTLVLRPDDDLAPFVQALEAGEPTVLPTDTVYGLACAAQLEAACERTLGLKERDRSKPTSIVVGSIDGLFAVLPELAGRAAAQAHRLLPGAVTIVVPNPARRFAWLCGDDPTRIGVRVPRLLPSIAAAIGQVGAIAATSANLAGGADPTALDEVPGELLSHVADAIDGGPSPAGRPSTVVDLTGETPVVLRAGAVTDVEIRRLLVD